jgi:hypothetical protein
MPMQSPCCSAGGFVRDGAGLCCGWVAVTYTGVTVKGTIGCGTAAMVMTGSMQVKHVYKIVSSDFMIIISDG